MTYADEQFSLMSVTVRCSLNSTRGARYPLDSNGSREFPLLRMVNRDIKFKSDISIFLRNDPEQRVKRTVLINIELFVINCTLKTVRVAFVKEKITLKR